MPVVYSQHIMVFNATFNNAQNKRKIHVQVRVNSIDHYYIDILRGVMVSNSIFNNISAIPWLSVLLVKETGGSGENH